MLLHTNWRPLLSLLILFIPLSVLGQNDIWQPISKEKLNARQKSSKISMPSAYQAFQLSDETLLKTMLREAPLRFSDTADRTATTIPLPMPDGSVALFEVFEFPIMESRLAERHPNIKTYTAAGITDPTAVAKIDFTPQGFHAMIRAVDENPVFIDPYNADEDRYLAYYKKDYPPPAEPFVCHVSGEEDIYQPEEIVENRAGDCQFREYRLALACTGEYADFHDDGNPGNGDAADDAMAAMATTMNRVNGVFENDGGITLVFVANNNLLIYTDTTNDPYTNWNTFAMLLENQNNCDAVIGSPNYDIGHVFGVGGGGVAFIGTPCNNSFKARGVTTHPNPTGDPFDIDYVSHEIGHQFGGTHTQNNPCSQDGSSSYEPGSASTIMGYAGICSPNVQNNSDDYFHAISLQQIGNYTTGGGNSCATIINTSNNQPTANAGSDYTIPISTPFVLTGIGTDADGDPLTYCWEQWDLEVVPMPPQSTNAMGPMFRSFKGTTTPERYFPRMSVLLGSGTDTWEVLPSVTRTLNFRLTVRDNNSAYGCTEEDDMSVDTDASAGPFLVTYPNTALTWNAGDTETVTWDVANTDVAPVSCTNVDIMWSNDDGLTWTALVSDVPNDGAQDIVVPSDDSQPIRIMVFCSDNIFFDISDQDITIVIPVPVELVEFDAQAKGESILLEWETASEVNNKGFDIERTEDPSKGFSKIGWTEGLGDVEYGQYRFLDTDVVAGVRYYYRLKQIDHDGAYSYSPVRSAQVEGQAPFVMRLQPNPVSDQLTMTLSNIGYFKGELRVVSAVGQLVLNESLEADGQYESTVDVQHLPTGVYFLSVRDDNGLRVVERFLKR